MKEQMTRDDRLAKCGRALLGVGLSMIATFGAGVLPDWFLLVLAFWGGLAMGIFL
jgi:hypothetical protein